MANPYPALITDANSETRIAGQITFTDPANQPQTFLVASVVLDDAQIKALPTTNPRIAIVAATEILNYAATPTELPVPVYGLAHMNIVNGDYTNVDDTTASVALVWGSDFSSTVSQLVKNSAPMTPLVTSQLFHAGSSPNSRIAPFGAADVDAVWNIENNLHDNGLYFDFFNAQGDLTDGGSSNTLTITVYYTLLTLA